MHSRRLRRLGNRGTRCGRRRAGSPADWSWLSIDKLSLSKPDQFKILHCGWKRAFGVALRSLLQPCCCCCCLQICVKRARGSEACRLKGEGKSGNQGSIFRSCVLGSAHRAVRPRKKERWSWRKFLMGFVTLPLSAGQALIAICSRAPSGNSDSPQRSRRCAQLYRKRGEEARQGGCWQMSKRSRRGEERECRPDS